MNNCNHNWQKIESPVKYYRKILNISQKELAGDRYSRGYIHYIEDGKRIPSYSCAIYIVEKLKEISKEREIKIDINTNEIMKNEEERIYDFFSEKIDIPEKKLQYDKHISYYKELLEDMKSYKFLDLERKVNRLIADMLMKKKEYIEAIEFYDRAFSETENEGDRVDNVILLRKKGICFYMMQEYEKAIMIFEKLEKIISHNQTEYYEENIKNLYNMGLAYKKNKNIIKSIKCIERALSYSEIDKNLRYKLELHLGNSYQESSNYEKALEIYLELYKSNPNEYLLNYNLAITYDYIGQKDKSEEHLKKCLENKLEDYDRKSVYSLMLLGKLRLERHDNISAEKCFEYAIDIARKSEDGEMLTYVLSNIYELLEKNGLSNRLIKYFEVVVSNKDIILKNKSNTCKMLIMIAKFSIDINLIDDNKERIRNILKIIEGRL